MTSATPDQNRRRIDRYLRGTSLAPRLGSSILLKVVGALAVALIVSNAVTAVVGARLTRRVLGGQAEQLASGHLRIAQEAFSEREKTLYVSLSNLSQTLSSNELTVPERRADLIGELGRVARNLELNLLEVRDASGMPLSPAADVGDVAATGPIGPAAGNPTSRLVPTNDGTAVQAVAVPLASPAGSLMLVGGFDFGDAFAFRLRRQLGDLAHVVLVASDKVAGSTLPESPSAPPAPRRRDGSAPLPTTPAVVRLGGVESLVAYAPVGRSPTDLTQGAVGIALVDPVTSLDKSLAQARLASTAVLSIVALGLGWLFFRVITRPLVRLARTAGSIARGDVSASFSTKGHDEIGLLADSLERMRLELGNKLALIAQQAADLQESSQRTVAAKDEERRRLARDLHDGIQQQLVVLRMRLGLAKEMAAGGPERPSERGGRQTLDSALLDEYGSELDGMIERLREVSHNLYPSILRDRGLTAAVLSSIARLPVPSRLTSSPDPFPRVAPELESAVYFLIFEAITNALKHSAGTEIAISLTLADDALTVEVADNGRGFELADVADGSGLVHMEDRARAFGGSLDIRAEPGRGTTIVAVFPVQEKWGSESGSTLAPDTLAGLRTGAAGVELLPPLSPEADLSRRSAEERTTPLRPGG